MRNRIIGVVLGLAAACAFLAFQKAHVQRSYYDVLPENRGAMDVIAIQYTRAAAPSLQPAYTAFLSDIDPGTKVICVCGDNSDAADFHSFLISHENLHPVRFQTVVVGASITGWCKDRFLVTSTSPAVLLRPRPPVTGIVARTNDSLIAGTIARAFPQTYREVQANLFFDSGDILATQTKLIVSDNLWRKNDGGHPDDAVAMAAFDRGLAAEFNRKVIHLHGVPDHHIGMFAAPLDDDTVVVGDPDLAKPYWNTKWDGELGRATFSPKIEAQFNAAASQLQAAGFRVIRVPEVYFAPQEYLAYTNAVFEIRNGKKIVYTPWYHMPALDVAGRTAY